MTILCVSFQLLICIYCCLKFANKVIVQIGEARQVSELEGLYKSLARKLPKKEPKLMRKLEKAKDDKKAELEKEDATV